MTSTSHGTPDPRDDAQDETRRQGNQITATDEEQMPSGLRRDLEPEDRDGADSGHPGDGGGVGKSL
jgi:hypothetical protein